MVAERWSAAPESLSDENEDVEEMKSVAPDAIDAAGDVAGYVDGWTGNETRIGAEDVEARPGDEDASKAEQLVEVLKTVLQDRVQQRTVEQIVDAPVLQAVEELAEVSKVFSQDRIQQRIVEQTIPAIPLAEKIVELPVIQTEENTQQGVNTLAQHVVDTIEVERPKIIDETVQKSTIQEKINQVTKHVEVPLVQFLDKVEEIPVVAQRQIPIVVQTIQKTTDIPQLQCIDEAIDDLFVQVPQVQVSEKTVEISQLQTAEKIVDTRETQMIQGILTGAMKPDDDPDARIKFLAEEELCRVGDPVFDANGNLVADELRRRDCVMGEMRKNKPPFRVALNRTASDEIARHCKHCTEREVTKLHESGTALAEGMRVPVSKMEELIAAHCQASLKTVKNPDRRPYPAYLSGKSWCEACGKTGSGKKFHHNVMSGVDFAAQHCSSQGTQQPHNKKEDVKRQREREEERRGEKGREENGRKSEEKGVRKEDEEGDSKVVKDATGWTVVTRNKRQRKMVQIFVKVDEAKVAPMDVSLTDGKIEDVIRQVQKGEDVYVTMQGKVLRRNEKLKSCGVTDGCTIQVTSRMRGGGKHKDKKSKAEKQAASAKTPEQKVTDGKEGDRGPATQECDLDAAIRMIEENEDSRKMTESMSEGSDEDMERTLQNCRTAGYEVLGWSQEQVEMMERGLRWAVEARRKGRRQQEEEQRRRGEQGHHLGQEQSKQGKHMRCGDEEQFEEAEVRTGRGSAGLVRGGR